MKRTQFLFLLLSANIAFISCEKGSEGSDDPTDIPSSLWKGKINSGPWEHGCILRDNGTARYLVSFTGGSMADTGNVNVTKYEGTYKMVTGKDSVYINCSNAGNTFRLRGTINAGKTGISGTWVHDGFGITNTLPFTMSK